MAQQLGMASLHCVMMAVFTVSWNQRVIIYGPSATAVFDDYYPDGFSA